MVGGGERRATNQRKSHRPGMTSRAGVRFGVGNNKKGVATNNQSQCKRSSQEMREVIFFFKRLEVGEERGGSSRPYYEIML